MTLARDLWVNSIAPHLSSPMIAALTLILMAWAATRSDAFGRQVWRRVYFARWWRTAMISAFLALTAAGAIGGAVVAWFSQKHYESTANLIQNPSFEGGAWGWGSGYLEDFVRNGNHPDEVGVLPYHVAPHPNKSDTRGSMCRTPRSRVEGDTALRSTPRKKTHAHGSLSQRVYGLRRGAQYVITFWAKASAPAEGTGARDLRRELEPATRPALESPRSGWSGQEGCTRGLCGPPNPPRARRS